MGESLAELQARFFALMSSDGSGDDIIAAPDAAAAAKQLAVYRDAYAARFRVVLRLEYPRTADALGDAFHRVVLRYVAAHPPAAGPIRAVGCAFAEFLESAGQPDAIVACARLEWARCEAYAAGEHVPLPLSALRAIPPQQWGNVLLCLAPSARRVADHVVWRRGDRTVERTIDAAEARALDEIGHGLAFATLCDHLIAHAGEDAPRVAFDLLRRWLSDGLLVDTISGTGGTPPGRSDPAS
jgi:hypothetical protein